MRESVRYFFNVFYRFTSCLILGIVKGVKKDENRDVK